MVRKILYHFCDKVYVSKVILHLLLAAQLQPHVGQAYLCFHFDQIEWYSFQEKIIGYHISNLKSRDLLNSLDIYQKHRSNGRTYESNINSIRINLSTIRRKLRKGITYQQILESFWLKIPLAKIPAHNLLKCRNIFKYLCKHFESILVSCGSRFNRRVFKSSTIWCKCSCFRILAFSNP